MVPQPSSGSAPSSKSSNSPAASDAQGSSPKLTFKILTLFPEALRPVLESSLIGKAAAKGLVRFELIQIRDFATDKHRTVDDTPCGGGAGMLLKPDILHAAWTYALPTPVAGETLTLLTSPQGRPLTQEWAKELATYREIVIVCGHYEGVDERFIELCVDQEISIGDFVLTGGELPALVIADCVTRVLPGVIGNEESVTTDSFEDGMLKYPQYTRPREFMGKEVPEVLLSGNHKEIAKWRAEQSRARTRVKRPDLLKK